jgi:hypothetical protein
MTGNTMESTWKTGQLCAFFHPNTADFMPLASSKQAEAIS